MREPDHGAAATADVRVTEGELASMLGDFPRVFATSRMIALMEVAAARVLQPLLGRPGSRVVATARFTGMDGRLFVFDVTAADEAGEVGRCTHKRAVVSNERLIAGADKRALS